MPRLAATFCSILCCVSLVWATRSERHTPWRAYQREYVRLLAEQGDRRGGTEPGILDVRGDRFGVQRVDRCTTCHVALTDARFAQGRPPLSTHPVVAGHPDAAETACTLCHQGNGRLLTAVGAHGVDPPITEPRLELRYTQAGCLRCHDFNDAARIAPKADAGRRLFLQGSCFGCHAVAGLSHGTVGPELTKVGRHRNGSYLRMLLTDPTMNNSHSPMPPVATDREKDLDELVTFLLTLRGTRQTHAYQP